MESKNLNESSPVKPFYNIDEVVAEAESLIIDSKDIDRAIFRQWAWRGERLLGFGGVNEEVAEVKVEDLSIRKPYDFGMPIDIALYDDAGNSYEYKYQFGKNRIYNQSPYQGKIDLSEDPYFFHLGSNGSAITSAKIRYYAIPIDSENNPMFPEHHIFAISMFIRWMWAMRKNESRSEIAQNKQDWIHASMQAKAANKMPSMLKAKEIAKKWMSMIDRVNYTEF